ncbi:hypothetical protein SLEP1_g55655 [Rubroshorea leprosula]|uniref:Uncharacterized protein n=1 Tax=Rubroshorea leprosula TaxID=152421 RepID=A0AAV5MG54_9ROSI|nr:hypothetical protein SLEP1_g55655 [Rubroshorea leprosula]
MHIHPWSASFRIESGISEDPCPISYSAFLLRYFGLIFTFTEL